MATVLQRACPHEGYEGKTVVQSFFMLTIVQPCAFASSSDLSAPAV
jgi:hypothetical protein